MAKSLSALKASLKALMKPIATNEVYASRRVYMMPTHMIHPTKSYSSLRDNNPSYGTTTGTNREVVNSFRSIIRVGKSKQLPPVSLFRKGQWDDHKEPYYLADGHHRLAAHKAEGKRYIRSIIVDDEDVGYSK
jgi:hypothetical protein